LLEHTLTIPSTIVKKNNLQFGISLSISTNGERVSVGVSEEGNYQGCVVVYRYDSDSNSYLEEQILYSLNREVSNRFGYISDMDDSGSIIVVSEYGSNNLTLFSRVGTIWSGQLLSFSTTHSGKSRICAISRNGEYVFSHAINGSASPDNKVVNKNNSGLWDNVFTTSTASPTITNVLLGVSSKVIDISNDGSLGIISDPWYSNRKGAVVVIEIPSGSHRNSENNKDGTYYGSSVQVRHDNSYSIATLNNKQIAFLSPTNTVLGRLDGSNVTEFSTCVSTSSDNKYIAASCRLINGRNAVKIFKS